MFYNKFFYQEAVWDKIFPSLFIAPMDDEKLFATEPLMRLRKLLSNSAPQLNSLLTPKWDIRNVLWLLSHSIFVSLHDLQWTFHLQ
jgi:hypothetical protein